MHRFEPGAAAAVLPIGTDLATDTLSIATVMETGSDSIELLDGRKFCEHRGQCIAVDGKTHIVPATKFHVAVVRRRCKR